MSTTDADAKALLAQPKDAESPASSVMVEVARKYGVSPFRQLREMFALRFGPGKLAFSEYYSNGLYDPDIPMPQKKEYVGRIGSWAINIRLSPEKLTYSRVFLSDKVMYTALLDKLGLPTTQTQAVAHKFRHFGTIPALRDPAAIEAFLRDDAVYPVFGKPSGGRGSVGTVLISGIEGDQVVLGNGRHVPLDGFAREAFQDYPEGFIFQTALTQHKVLADVAGAAIGTLRVVTVREGEKVRVLYSVWKVPSPTAMSDNFWQSGSMVAQVDETGRVGKCRVGTGLEGRYVETHPVSGARFDELQMPHWDAICTTACDGHALFPEFGLVGWDIAVTPEGPVLIECNDNSFHVLWQLANGRGVNNAEFTPVFDRVAETSQAMLAEREATYRKRERAKGRRA